ncbi:MAG: alpha/beta hydrolase [Firmicutes bacterium]|nr:alpha/beta hydrolase [Bacillota bacterium]
MMYYEEYGDQKNPTIVLLHCAAIVEIYLKQHELSSQYHLIIPHLYGSGREVKQDFELEKTMLALIRLIKGLGSQPVYLVGHSEGANLALALVSQEPELFKKAIISSPMVDENDRISRRKASFVSLLYPLIKKRWMGKVYVKFLGIDEPDQAQFFLDYWTKISRTTWKNYFTDRVTFEKYPGFPVSSVPILCLYGEKEPKVIAATVKKMLALNPHCEVKRIEKVGHDHPIKKWRNFQAEMKGFFRS